jgi:ribosome maturation protein SDO1
MSTKGRQTMDHERVSFNLAKFKKNGIMFEIAVNPDLAIDFKNGKSVDIKEVIRSEKIFTDVKKGEFSQEHDLKEVFGTTDVLAVAKIILKEGEIQLTEEYREKQREDKKKKIVFMIHKIGVDPRTNLPLPIQRIENAMEQARAGIDMYKSAEEQVDEIIKKLRPILPISTEKKTIHIKFTPEYAGKAYAIMSGFGKPDKEQWKNDGSFECQIEIPAGMETDLYEKLNSATKGNIQTKIVK